MPGCAPDTPKQQGLTRPDSEQREGWAACKHCVRFLFGKVRCCLGHARKEGEFCHVKSNSHVLVHSSASCPAQSGEGEERGGKKKSSLQCSSPVLGSLGFVVFCSTAAFLRVTVLPALVLLACLPQFSFISRSKEAGSVGEGISKPGVCSPRSCAGLHLEQGGEHNQGWESAQKLEHGGIYQGSGKFKGVS